MRQCLLEWTLVTLISCFRYYLSKEYIPLEIEFMVSDSLEPLRPKHKRYQSYEEVSVEVL